MSLTKVPTYLQILIISAIVFGLSFLILPVNRVFFFGSLLVIGLVADLICWEFYMTSEPDTVIELESNNAIDRFRSLKRWRNVTKGTINMVIAVFTFSVTIYSIVCSVFAGVMSGQNTNILNPVEIKQIARQQMSEDLPLKLPPISTQPTENQTKYNFLFVVDFTGSTKIETQTKKREYAKDKEFQNYVKKLETYKGLIISKIEVDSTKQTKYQEMDLKSLIAYFLADKLKSSSYQSSKMNISYIKNQIHTISQDTKNAWGPISGFEFPRETLIEKAKEKGNGELTNFESIIQDLKKQSLNTSNYDNQNKLIVTIISDFYHDDNSTTLQQVEKEIQGLADFENMHELNLIKIPLVSESEEKGSEKLIQLFNKHFRHIPQREERLLNSFSLTESEFILNLESIIFPTELPKLAQLEFKFTNTSSDLFSTIKLPDSFEGKSSLMKIRADNFEDLQNSTIQYSILDSEDSTENGYPKLVNLDRINMIPAGTLDEVCMIELILKNAPREGFSNVGIEFYAQGSNQKYLVPIVLSERLTPTTAKVILVSAWIMIITLYILGFFGYMLLFFHILHWIQRRKKSDILPPISELVEQDLPLTDQEAGAVNS